jgi:hypothetical protein
MSIQPPPVDHVKRGRALVRQSFASSLIEAAILSVFGWGILASGQLPESPTPVDLAVFVIPWAFRIGGALLGMVALTSLGGQPSVLLTELVVNALLGFVFLAGGGVLYFAGGDITGVLIGLVGIVGLTSVHGTLDRYRLAKSLISQPPNEGLMNDPTGQQAQPAPREEQLDQTLGNLQQTKAATRSRLEQIDRRLPSSAETPPESESPDPHAAPSKQSLSQEADSRFAAPESSTTEPDQNRSAGVSSDDTKKTDSQDARARNNDVVEHGFLADFGKTDDDED